MSNEDCLQCREILKGPYPDGLCFTCIEAIDFDVLFVWKNHTCPVKEKPKGVMNYPTCA